MNFIKGLLPNPYLILGVIVAILSTFGIGFEMGVKNERRANNVASIKAELAVAKKDLEEYRKAEERSGKMIIEIRKKAEENAKLVEELRRALSDGPPDTRCTLDPDSARRLRGIK